MYSVHILTKLYEQMLSPDWAMIPEFTAMPILEDHYGMTKLSRKRQQFRRIFEVYEAWLSDIEPVLRGLDRHRQAFVPFEQQTKSKRQGTRKRRPP